MVEEELDQLRSHALGEDLEEVYIELERFVTLKVIAEGDELVEV